MRTFHVTSDAIGEADDVAVLAPDGADAVQRAWQQQSAGLAKGLGGALRSAEISEPFVPRALKPV